MLDLANLRPGNSVLDVAAGTGDQTLMAAARVGPTGYVLATDISANMLKLASDAVREAGLMNVETRVTDAENIDLNEKLVRLGRMQAGPHVVSQSGQSSYRDAARGETSGESGRARVVK